MKSFRSFLKENNQVPVLQAKDDDWQHTQLRSRDLRDHHIRTELNIQLLKATDGEFLNPGMAIERIKKVLAYYAVLLPRQAWPAVDGGELVYSVEPFGHVDGVQLDGSNAKHDKSREFYLYFEYQSTSHGKYICFGEFCDEAKLTELLNDDDDDQDIDNT